MAQQICSFVLPPVLGMVVMVDPSGEYGREYMGQSSGGTGVINSTSSQGLSRWHRLDENEKRGIGVRVKWDNGTSNSYNVRDLLPISGKYKDLVSIELNRGDSLFGTEEELKARLDDELIVKGRTMASKRVYGEEYRTQIFKECANRFNERLSSGSTMNEYQMATIDELAKLGLMTVETPPTPPTPRGFAEEAIGESVRASPPPIDFSPLFTGTAIEDELALMIEDVPTDEEEYDEDEDDDFDPDVIF